MTSLNLRSVAADSNVLLAAIAGRAALRVFDRPELQIVTTDENVVEVREKVPQFAKRYGVAEEELFEALALLPVEIYIRRQYATHVFEARSLLAQRDPDDVPLAALALKLGVPIWSNDHDFDDFPTGVYSPRNSSKCSAFSDRPRRVAEVSALPRRRRSPPHAD